LWNENSGGDSSSPGDLSKKKLETVVAPIDLRSIAMDLAICFQAKGYCNYESAIKCINNPQKYKKGQKTEQFLSDVDHDLLSTRVQEDEKVKTTLI